MSTLLLIAADLAIALAAAHSYLGERYILVRLFRRADLPRLFGGTEFTRRTLRFAWHLTSVAWTGFAALLVTLAAPDGASRRPLALSIAATFFVSGLVTVVASRGRHLAWIVFFAIAALVWLSQP